MTELAHESDRIYMKSSFLTFFRACHGLARTHQTNKGPTSCLIQGSIPTSMAFFDVGKTLLLEILGSQKLANVKEVP